jgi:hypothetical protein
VVADTGCGQNPDFRDCLDGSGIGQVVAIRPDVTVHPHDAEPVAPPCSGDGPTPQPRYRDKPSPVTALAADHGRQAFTAVRPGPLLGLLDTGARQTPRAGGRSAAGAAPPRGSSVLDHRAETHNTQVILQVEHLEYEGRLGTPGIADTGTTEIDY